MRDEIYMKNHLEWWKSIRIRERERDMKRNTKERKKEGEKNNGIRRERRRK